MVYEKLPGGRCLTNVSHNPSSGNVGGVIGRHTREKNEGEVRSRRLIENTPGLREHAVQRNQP